MLREIVQICSNPKDEWKKKENPPTAVLRKQEETKIVWSRKLPKPNLLLLCLKTAAMDADGMAPDFRLPDGSDGQPEGRR